MTSPTLLNGANNSGIAANGGNSVFAGGRKELAMRLLQMPSSQSPKNTPNKTANGQEEETKSKIGIPIGVNSSFGDSFQEDQHSMFGKISYTR